MVVIRMPTRLAFMALSATCIFGCGSDSDDEIGSNSVVVLDSNGPLGPRLDPVLESTGMESGPEIQQEPSQGRDERPTIPEQINDQSMIPASGPSQETPPAMNEAPVMNDEPESEDEPGVDIADSVSDDMAVDDPNVSSEPSDDDTPAERPNYPLGPVDLIARRACTLLDEPAREIQIVELEDEAGQVLLTPQPETGFSMTIPETGFGYLTLEVPDWAITIAASTYFEHTVTIFDPDGVTQEIVPLSWNGACPDKGLTDHRTKYHSWGSFTVKVEGEPNSVMTLSFIKQN